MPTAHHPHSASEELTRPFVRTFVFLANVHDFASNLFSVLRLLWMALQTSLYYLAEIIDALEVWHWRRRRGPKLLRDIGNRLADQIEFVAEKGRRPRPVGSSRQALRLRAKNLRRDLDLLDDPGGFEAALSRISSELIGSEKGAFYYYPDLAARAWSDFFHLQECKRPR